MTTNIFDVSTKEDAAKILADYLLQNINNELDRRVSLHRDSFYMFWYSKDSSPQQLCDAMGTNAKLFFEVASANVAHIANVAEIAGKSLNNFLTPEQYTPPKPVFYNADGTVTIGE